METPIVFTHLYARDLQDMEATKRLSKTVDKCRRLAEAGNLLVTIFLEDGLYHELWRSADDKHAAPERPIPFGLRERLDLARRELDGLEQPGVQFIHAADLAAFVEALHTKSQSSRHRGRLYSFAAGRQMPLRYDGPKFVRDLVAINQPTRPVINLDEDVIVDAKEVDGTARAVNVIATEFRQSDSDELFAVSGIYSRENLLDQYSTRLLQFAFVSRLELRKLRRLDRTIQDERIREAVRELLYSYEVELNQDSAEAFLREVAAHVKDQFLSGAGYCANSVYLKKFPEFCNLRANAVWCDDHWPCQVRRGPAFEKPKNSEAEFQQQRHPNGAAVKDLLWHTTQYVPRLCLGIAGLAILENTSIRDAAEQRRTSCEPRLVDELWYAGCEALRKVVNPESRKLFKDTMFESVVEGHPIAREHGFLNPHFNPGGLLEAVQGLPHVFPLGHPDDGSMTGELKKLVEDLAVWATDMSDWWHDAYVKVAESIELDLFKSRKRTPRASGSRRRPDIDNNKE